MNMNHTTLAGRTYFYSNSVVICQGRVVYTGVVTWGILLQIAG